MNSTPADIKPPGGIVEPPPHPHRKGLMPSAAQVAFLEVLAPSTYNLPSQDPDYDLDEDEQQDMKLEFLELLALRHEPRKSKMKLKRFIQSYSCQRFGSLHNDSMGQDVAMRRYLDSIDLVEEGEDSDETGVNEETGDQEEAEMEDEKVKDAEIGNEANVLETDDDGVENLKMENLKISVGSN